MATKKRKRTSPLLVPSHDSAAAGRDGNCRSKRPRVPNSKSTLLPPAPTAASAPAPGPTPARIPATEESRQLEETPPPVLAIGTSVSHCPPPPIHHPVLSQYFPRLLSLRVYLRHVLSSSNRLGSLKRLAAIDSSADAELLSLLDTTLIGSKRPAANATLDIADATQSGGESHSQSYTQSEIVDLALHTLFYRSNTRPSEAAYPGKPNNILAQGYRVNNNGSYYSVSNQGPLDLDVMNYYPNTHITTLKSRLWGKVLEIIGEGPMLDLLLNTSVFLQLNQDNDVSKSNYYQLAGPPISYSMNKALQSNKLSNAAPTNVEGSVRARSAGQSLKRPVTEIDSFVAAAKRAKATHGSCFRGTGNSTEGGGHVDVSKHRDLRTPGEVMQFNLHNVFTSMVDRKETIQPLKDYTLREHEIAAAQNAKTGGVPKRLKGKVLDLIERMMRLHKRCSYHALIKYYCPVLICDSSDQVKPTSQSFTDYACTTGQVSGFAKAVMSNVVPREFWGSEGNRRVFMGNLDRFVKLRRYETLSLHEVMQGMKLVEFSWLSTPNAGGKKLSESDARKRLQILAEFMYYMFDSLLVPLLRAHFYVTESNVHRNRVFYFRHDVWKRLSEPTISRLKGEMLTELKTDQARRVLDGRKLGFSTVRLLPKEKGIRPIMNLRKRGMVVERGRTVLTQSINSVMTPVFNVLSFEKARKPVALGSSLFNVREMYEKLNAFQRRLLSTHETLPKLYFAKVDVQSCFDTIPQRELLKVVEAILTEDEYRIHKFAEVKALAPTGKIAKKFIAKAGCVDEFGKFEGVAKTECSSRKRRGTVWVEDVIQTYKERNDLLELLEEHVKVNIIKIGKKFFRQKSGIPQGSVLSTILCNFFYGDLERSKLPFVSASTGVLLRLIDDFLFITLNRGHAEQFLRVMHAGHPEYGAFVSAEKSLANFKVSVDGRKINQLVGTQEFPYCGNLIHSKTLGIRRDRVKKVTSNVDDTLTVEYSRNAGKSLHRKAVSAFKYQAHAMYFDTNFNTLQTVFKNIYHNFTEAAMKFHRSVRALPRHPSSELLVKTVSDVLDLAFVMIKGCQEKCAVTRTQVKWLGARAFGRVLKRKQTGYRGLLQWLDETARHEERRVGLARRVDVSGYPFVSFRY